MDASGMGIRGKESELLKLKRQVKAAANMRNLDELAEARLGQHWPRQKPRP